MSPQVDIPQLDKKLAEFGSSDFTSSRIFFAKNISQYNYLKKENSATVKLFNLIDSIQQSYPPVPENDVSRIEDIYS